MRPNPRSATRGARPTTTAWTRSTTPPASPTCTATWPPARRATSSGQSRARMPRAPRPPKVRLCTSGCRLKLSLRRPLWAERALILCAVDAFQAIYSEGAQPYFSMLWERLLDSVEQGVGTAQALKVVGFLYASSSMTDCPRLPGAVKRPQRSLVFSIEDQFCMALLYGRAGRLTALFGGFGPGQRGMLSTS